MREELTVQATLRLMRGGKAFGPGVAGLLERVRACGSLRRAAGEMGMSYNKAWHIMRESEDRLGVPLLTRRIGGVQGGGAALTPQAEDWLARYRAFEADAHQALADLLQKHFEGMKTEWN